jgi:hypothetical protein
VTLYELVGRFPGGDSQTGGTHWVYCPLHQLYDRTVCFRQGVGGIRVEATCRCPVESILGAVGLDGDDLRAQPFGHGTISTPKVGGNSGRPAEFGPAPVGTRFRKGNPYRWKRGQSGNPRGRRRKEIEADIHSRLLDHTALLHDLQRRLRPQRDSRFERFKVYYEDTGNAHQSALRAGYAKNTARSKSYLLARRAREMAAGGQHEMKKTRP